MNATGYSIKDLEVLSGVKAHTIRIWEKRYNILEPERTDTNIRYYSDGDLKRMLNVSLLVKNGFKISKVARWNENEIKNNVISIFKDDKADVDYIDKLMLYMLEFDNISFSRLTAKIIDEYGLEEASFNIFFKLFQRIGTYWQVGTIFPAQEHFVTNVFRQKVIAAINNLEITNSKNMNMLFFLPENEMHEMSLLFYAYLAQKSGYNVIYLGQFVPIEDLTKIQDHVDISFVFTSFVNAIEKTELENYLIKLKSIFHNQKVFITGWQVNNHNPALPRNVKTVKDYREFKKYLG